MTQSRPKDGPKTEGQAEPTAPKAALLAGAPFALQAMGQEIINTTGVRAGRARSTIDRYAVVITLGLFIVGFSLLLPKTFFTIGNFRTIVSSQAILMILALGLTLPLTTGEFDLSIGSMLGALRFSPRYSPPVHCAWRSSSSSPSSSGFLPARLTGFLSCASASTPSSGRLASRRC